MLAKAANGRIVVEWILDVSLRLKDIDTQVPVNGRVAGKWLRDQINAGNPVPEPDPRLVVQIVALPFATN